VTVVAVVLLLVVAYVGIKSRHSGLTARGLEAGSRLPPFAAPVAVGPLTGDVNVATRRGQGAAGDVPACRLRGVGILNICQQYERGPVVIAFVITSGAQCVRQLDTMERLRADHRGVRFAAVALRGSRDELRRLVRSHRWGFPVGYDRDGVLATLYGVAVCPLITFALPGGTVTGTSVGELRAPQLDQRLRALEAAARRRGWSPPGRT
jgi:hypothetical protein